MTLDQEAWTAPPTDDPEDLHDSPLVDRLQRQLQAATELAAAGGRVSAAAARLRQANLRLDTVARNAANSGLTWPEIRQALGPADDTDLPTQAQLYDRTRRKPTVEPSQGDDRQDSTT